MTAATRIPTLRALAWALHLLVTFLAVFSLCTNRFDLWIDLRSLGPVGTILTKIAWASTILLIPWCAGPRLTGIRRGSWINAGWSPPAAKLLFIPTYFILACLIANTVYYYLLIQNGTLEPSFPIPITLVAALLLIAWILSTRAWIRTPKTAAKSPATLRTQILTIAFSTVSVLLLAEFFALHMYANPPTEPVDLAVVLGNDVHNDGTASAVLRDRTLAAVNLYQRGLVKRIFLSGDIRQSPDPHALRNEPAAMFQVCIDHGVPASAITLDPYGINTKATAFNAREYMQARGLTTVVACSDDYHLFRIATSFKQLGITAYTQPAIPQEWICADLATVVRETTAILVYQFDRNYRPAKEPVMLLNSPKVVVRKSQNVLEIYETRLGKTTLVKTYPCITGGNPGDKQIEGDRKTPTGNFHIVFKNPDSKFHLSLGLDYPTAEDAKRGLTEKLITQAQYNGILEALKSDLTLKENQQKLWYTPLGGEIFIHGHAEGRTGTAGCIALSNPDIDELYPALPEGTPVEILP